MAKSNTIVLIDNNSHSPNKEKDDKGLDIFVNTYPQKVVKTLVSTFDHVRISELCTRHSSLMLFPDDIQGKEDDPVLFDAVPIKDGHSITHYRFKTGNLMGFVGIQSEKENQFLRIKSRFDVKNDNDFFLQFLLLKIFNFNIFKNLDYTKDPKTQAFDWLMMMFPHYLKKAYAQGIFRTYTTFRYNDANVRGVIDVSRHLRKNVPFNGKVAYNAREYTRNNPLMQLVRHTIECIDRHYPGKDILRSDMETREAVDVIRQYTSYISTDLQQVISQNTRLVSHPYYTAYSELQNICLKILRHERIGYGNGKDTVFGMIFDGAWLWEEYIATITSKYLKHYTNKTKDFFLFREKEGAGVSKPFQWIIPDYLGSDGTNNIVADAKYIPLSGKRQLPAEQAEGVYYKTIMYMLRFKAKKAFLFYPYSSKDIEDENENEKNNDPIINDFVIDENEEYHLYKVGLPIPEVDTFAEFMDSMKDIEKKFKKALADLIEHAVVRT